jgi:hypothetical protein
MCRGTTVGIAAGYGLDNRGVGVRALVRSSPPNLLSDRQRGGSSREQSGRGVKLTIHFQLEPRSIKRGSTHPLPIRLHGTLLSQLSPRTASPFTREYRISLKPIRLGGRYCRGIKDWGREVKHVLLGRCAG